MSRCIWWRCSPDWYKMARLANLEQRKSNHQGGKRKWPLRIDGNDFTYFRIQLMVWGGITPYLLLCCIIDLYCSTCFGAWQHKPDQMLNTSLCITIEVRWNVSFCFLHVQFSSNIQRRIFQKKKKKPRWEKERKICERLLRPEIGPWDN